MERTSGSLILPLAVMALACQSIRAPVESASPGAATAERWNCHNDLEISCDRERCESAESFTPMDVTVDEAGAMSVCAYSGCWEGTGTVTRSARFVVLMGHGLSFSTAQDAADGRQDIVIAIDREDHAAILKAGSFAHPLRCEKLERPR